MDDRARKKNIYTYTYAQPFALDDGRHCLENRIFPRRVIPNIGDHCYTSERSKVDDGCFGKEVRGFPLMLRVMMRQVK